MTNCKYIDDYINLVRKNEYPSCKEQYLLCDYVEKVFKEEDIYVNIEQLEKYLSYQKYFPYKLFEWEKFCFTLHNCTYKRNGQLRFPILFVYVGRGAGKNGYLAFEDFCLLTPTNGVREYNIDIFATSEDQAKASWQDVYNVLEDNKSKMEKHFHWTKETIVNLKTNSTFSFNTSNPKTKDGARPGKVDFDEIHAYENNKLIGVAVTGLGKKAHPRRTYITTDGNVRDGFLDAQIDNGLKILNGEKEDNGTLPFMCRLDNEEEIHDKAMWHKANPSLRYFPNLLQVMEIEYSDYLIDPIQYSDFATKRMNRPTRATEGGVTDWDNIEATNQEIDESLLKGMPCVAGIDYMQTTDFLSAGLLYRVNGKDYWITHTWVCKECRDLPRIKADLKAWERKGLLTFVDAREIPPELPAIWLANEAGKRNSQILKIGIDSYRYQLLSKALRDIYFSAEKDFNNVVKIRPSDEMKIIPTITSGFINYKFVWGDNELMRWYCNNSKIIISPAGNMTYGKIDPKPRKTDGFKAFVMAECVADVLDVYQHKSNKSDKADTTDLMQVYTY